MIHEINTSNGLSKILPTLGGGDVVQLATGEYSLPQIALTANGSIDAPITVHGADAVITGGTIEVRGDYWIFEGISFKGYADDVFKVGNDSPSRGTSFVNCKFKRNKGRPLALLNAIECTIEGCLFQETNTGVEGQGAHALEPIIVDKLKIIDNIFRDNASDCIQFGGVSRAETGEVLVEGNEFIAPPAEGEGGENGVDVKHVSKGPIVFRNNLFTGYRPCRVDGVGHKGGSNGAALVLHVGAQNVQVIGNMFKNNTRGIVVSDQTHRGKPPTINNTIESNTILLSEDFPGNDFRPSGRGIGIGIARLDGSNVFRNNIYAACSNAVEIQDSPEVTTGNDIIFNTVAEYEAAYSPIEPDPPSSSLDDLTARVETIEGEMVRLREIVETMSLKERIDSIEKTLNEIAEILR